MTTIRITNDEPLYVGADKIAKVKKLIAELEPDDPFAAACLLMATFVDLSKYALKATNVDGTPVTIGESAKFIADSLSETN